MAPQLSLLALADFPLVEPGDDVAELLLAGLQKNNIALQKDDVIVIAQKIISKAENRYAYLNSVIPGAAAVELAEQTQKDSRLVQLILDESKEVVRSKPGVIIVEHKLGYVHANAGIDQSNITSEQDNPRVLLLPENSDASAAFIRQQIQRHLGIAVNIIINDSAGRAWRNGTIGFALGTAGFEPINDLIGESDLFNRPLQTSTVAVADELAAAASFMMGQAAEARPVVIIRGANLAASNQGSGSLIREKQHDLFR